MFYQISYELYPVITQMHWYTSCTECEQRDIYDDVTKGIRPFNPVTESEINQEFRESLRELDHIVIRAKTVEELHDRMNIPIGAHILKVDSHRSMGQTL